MIEINLLPVREARRRERVRFQISIFILSLLLVFAIIAYLKWNINLREREVDAQIATVKAELRKLDKVIRDINRIKKEKEKLEKKIQIIGSLERGRMGAAMVMDEISRRVPEKVWLEKMSKNGRSLKLEGIALDEETIANFMTSLEKSKYIKSVELEVTERIESGGVKLKKFSLRCVTTI